MIDELIAASRELYDRKLIHAAGGNTSIRDGDSVWISQTGAELGKLTADKLVKVDLDGTVLEGKAPSKEMNMHLAMYRARKNARAVVHVHPTYAIALSTLIGRESNDAVPPYTMAFYVRAGRVPMIPYHPSGAHSLHEAVAALAPAHHAILLRQHGRDRRRGRHVDRGRRCGGGRAVLPDRRRDRSQGRSADGGPIAGD